MLFGNLRNTVKTSKNSILDQLVCNFFKQKTYCRDENLCFFAQNYALIARFKVIFKPLPEIRVIDHISW